jgi:hypothetical protein
MADEQQQEVKLTPTEEKAVEQGWMPEKDFYAVEGNKEKKWFPASYFLDRGELLNRIESQNKRVKEMDKALKSMSELHDKIRLDERKKTIDDLKIAKVEALKADNHEKVVEIDDKIADIKAEEKADKNKKQEPTVHPDFAEWIVDNGWYGSDQELHDAADILGFKYSNAHKGAAPKDIYVHVTKEIKKLYPEKFGTINQNRTRTSPTEGAGDHSSRKNSKDDFELTEMEEKALKPLVATKMMTREKYIEELKKIDPERGKR